MPGFNGTGPEGQGSQTGRRLGKCNPNNKDANNELPQNRGMRKGLGLARRLRLGNGNKQRRGQGFGKFNA